MIAPTSENNSRGRAAKRPGQNEWSESEQSKQERKPASNFVVGATKPPAGLAPFTAHALLGISITPGPS